MVKVKVVPPKSKFGIKKDYSPFYRQASDYMASSTKNKINKGIKPGNKPLTRKIKGSNLTLRDSGGLLSSIHSESDNNSGAVVTNHKAAKINQEGGEIKPKKAKRLAVPAGKRTRELMRSYGATPRLCIDRMKTEGWNVWTTKTGVIMAQETKKSRPFPLFVLKSKIKIPKRRFMFFSKVDREVISAMFKNYVLGR